MRRSSQHRLSSGDPKPLTVESFLAAIRNQEISHFQGIQRDDYHLHRRLWTHQLNKIADIITTNRFDESYTSLVWATCMTAVVDSLQYYIREIKGQNDLADNPTVIKKFTDLLDEVKKIPNASYKKSLQESIKRGVNVQAIEISSKKSGKPVKTDKKIIAWIETQLRSVTADSAEDRPPAPLPRDSANDSTSTYAKPALRQYHGTLLAQGAPPSSNRSPNP